MLGERFDALFADLLARWEVWWRASRDPDRVVELASARMHLDDARAAIAQERIRSSVPLPAGGSRTSVSSEDRARLAVRGVGYVQG